MVKILKNLSRLLGFRDKIIFLDKNFEVVIDNYFTDFLPRYNELLWVDETYYRVVNIIHGNKLHWVIVEEFETGQQRN